MVECNTVPDFVLDQKKLKNCQHIASYACLIPSIRNNTYTERLNILNLTSVCYTQRSDLVLCTKLLTITLTWILNFLKTTTSQHDEFIALQTPLIRLLNLRINFNNDCNSLPYNLVLLINTG